MAEEPNRKSLERLLDSDVLRRVLEKAYLEVESGLEPNWLDIANGDIEMATVARRVVIGAERTSAPFARSTPRAEIEPTEEISRIAEFEIIDVLGVGGMSRVYLANQTSLDRLVALKVLDPGLAADPSRRARFRREAEITASLDHPAIVPIYGVGEDEGRSFIAMKLLDGLSLEAIERLFSPREAAALGAVVAEALHTAHLAGIIHRDVKPSNIILEDESPVLLDFGLAWAFNQTELTAIDAAPGTLAYMSPEQLQGGRGLDPRTDIFSLAATLHELVAGERLFGADSPAAVISRITQDEPRKLDIDRGDRDFETILLKALAKDRESRFGTALEMAEDLRRYLAGTPILSRRTGLVRRGVLAFQRNRRTATLALLLGACLLALGLILSFQHWRQVELDAQLQARVEGELEAGRLEVANTLALGLEGAKHDGLRERISASIALEQLEDRVLDFGNLRDGDRLRRLLAETRIDPARSDLEANALLVLVEAAFMLEEKDRARTLLDRHDALFGPGRASRALRLLIDTGKVDMVESLPLPALDADRAEVARQHVHTCLAMDLAGAPTALRRRELDRAFAADPDDFGARHLAGRLAFEEGDYQAATAYYRGLVRRGRLTDCALSGVASCLLAQGDRESARAILSGLSELEAWPEVMRLKLELAAHDDDAEFMNLLMESRAAWPKEGAFLLLAAVQAFNKGATANALRMARDADSLRLDASGRAHAVLLIISCFLTDQALSGRLKALDGDDPNRARLLDLQRRLTTAVAQVPVGRRLAVDVRLMAVRLQILLGDSSRAKADLDRLIRDEPAAAAPIIFKAQLIDAACGEECSQVGRLEEKSPLYREALEAAQSLENIANQGKGLKREFAILLLVRLSSWTENWAEFDLRLGQFISECSQLNNPGNLRVVEGLQKRSFGLR